MKSPDNPSPLAPPILTVGELTSEIRFQLAQNFSHILVMGEISGLTKASSGHAYFTLKDAQAQISAVAWRTNVQRLMRQGLQLTNGLQVICSGEIEVYPPRGNYQLIVKDVDLVGQGKMELAFRQLKEKLERDGYFDKSIKQPLPKYPRRIALITSPSGAAVRDFLQVLNRRWPNLEVILVPVRVQGKEASQEIVRALQLVHQFADLPDVIVVTRGGGSLEDLWAFNEERVVQAIYACTIPVMTGIGHEIDVTLADLVADVRALTPTEAAERLLPDQFQIKRQLQDLQRRLENSLVTRHQHSRQLLNSISNRRCLTDPQDRVQRLKEQLAILQNRMIQAMIHRRSIAHSSLAELRQHPALADPMSRLKELRSPLGHHASDLHSRINQRFQQAEKMVVQLKHHLQRFQPVNRIQLESIELDRLADKMRVALDRNLRQHSARLGELTARLNSISPLAVLERGYSLTTDSQNKLITSTTTLQTDDIVNTRLNEGEFVSRIIHVKHSSQ